MKKYYIPLCVVMLAFLIATLTPQAETQITSETEFWTVGKYLQRITPSAASVIVNNDGWIGDDFDNVIVERVDFMQFEIVPATQDRWMYETGRNDGGTIFRAGLEEFNFSHDYVIQRDGILGISVPTTISGTMLGSMEHFVAVGDLLNIKTFCTNSASGIVFLLIISINDTVIATFSEITMPPLYGFSVNVHSLTNAIQAAPVITHSPDIDFRVGDTIDWTYDIQAHSGISTKSIPPFGTIEIDTLVAGTDPALSLDGNVATHVGVSTHTYTVRDEHSLSALHPFDNTFATTTRSITVWTTESPKLLTRYAASLGMGLAGLDYDYDAELPLPCGGEQGWTNHPLDISIDPDTILGTFDTILTLPDLSTTVPGSVATRSDYQTESSSILGTPVSGVLTVVGDASNELSGMVIGRVKIDRTNPIPAATHVSEYNFTDTSSDELSGMSLTNPSRIAFSAPAGAQPEISDFELFGSISVKPDGLYDVWVFAADKAGNRAIARVLSDVLLVNGAVEITKDTDQGATLHVVGCSNAGSIHKEISCGSDCAQSAGIQIEEKSALTYKLTLTNTDTINSATGSFTDYLPLGSVVSTTPSAIPASAASGLDFQLLTSGAYAGHYKVTGNYTLSPGAQVEIEILCEAPAFDKVTPANNIIRNQATVDWTIDTRNGSNDSNYALHELIEKPGVDTLFTKVGAEDITQGIVGVEFVLYRWDGALAPTTGEQNHIVDYSVLVDNALPGGDWIRVTYDGEDALALSDIFVSSVSPLGEVDLGTLPEGIYTLIETKTSGGYALPVGQWILTIDPSKGDTGAGDWKIEFVGKSNSIAPPAAIRDESIPNDPTYKIVNAEPFLIGLSGLGGTTGMLLVGFVLMAIVGNIYLVRRYKQKEKQK